MGNVPGSCCSGQFIRPVGKHIKAGPIFTRSAGNEAGPIFNQEAPRLKRAGKVFCYLYFAG